MGFVTKVKDMNGTGPQGTTTVYFIGYNFVKAICPDKAPTPGSPSAKPSLPDYP